MAPIHPRRCLALAVLALVAAGVGCTTDERGALTTAPAPSSAPSHGPASSAAPGGNESTGKEPAPARFDQREVPCPSTVPATAVCRVVVVPADWNHPDDPATFELPVAVLPARTSPARGAVVIPAGGPGFEGVVGPAAYWRTSAINDSYDVVLYDQRGVGVSATFRSTPSLDCPEVDAAVVRSFERARPVTQERGDYVSALQQCRTRLEAAGVDVGAVSTAANVADLEAVRQALGYRQWSILGVSYGARLALAALATHPETLQAVVLDSVSLDTGVAALMGAAERAVALLASTCASDQVCVARHGDLGARLDELRASWNSRPVEAEVAVVAGRPATRVQLDGDDLMGYVVQTMYDGAALAMLPALLESLAGRDSDALTTMVQQLVGFRTGLAEAMHASVECADAAGRTDAADLAAVADPGRWGALAVTVTCADWPVRPEPLPGVVDPAGVPVLVLAGAFDPVTTPEGARRVADALGAPFVLLEDQGHGVVTSACGTRLAVAFLAAPARALDTSCAASGPPLFA